MHLDVPVSLIFRQILGSKEFFWKLLEDLIYFVAIGDSISLSWNSIFSILSNILRYIFQYIYYTLLGAEADNNSCWKRRSRSRTIGSSYKYNYNTELS